MSELKNIFEEINKSLDRLEKAIMLDIEIEKAELKAHESEGARNAR